MLYQSSVIESPAVFSTEFVFFPVAAPMSKKTTHIKEKKREIRNPLYNDIMSDRQLNPRKRQAQTKGVISDEVHKVPPSRIC